MGRLKDLVIVDGQNHFPDDIEATVQEITGGRVAAVGISQAQTEQLPVMIAEDEARTHFQRRRRTDVSRSQT